MNMMDIEAAARTAWPALEEKELPFGVLRYSRGTDRRSNSLSLHPHAEVKAGELVSVVEDFFAQRGAAPIVRIVRAEENAIEALCDIDTALSDRGYEKKGLTLSMLLDLSTVSVGSAVTEHASNASLDVYSWLQGWYTLTNRLPENIGLHRALLQKSDLLQMCLLSRDTDGCPISSGMGVFANQTIGLFGIATAVDQRKKGYALATVKELLSWGVAKGAKYAYLQVEESNQPAVSLYKKLGFKTSYSYWYRVGKHKVCGNEE